MKNPPDAEEAFRRLRKTADLYNLYRELASFSFSGRSNAATEFFNKRRRDLDDFLKSTAPESKPGSR